MNMKRFDHHDDETHEVLTERKVFRVPMVAMDGLQRAVAAASPFLNDTAMHRPGYAPLSDDQRTTRERLYADAEQRLTDRWKNPSPLAADTATPAPQPVDPALSAQDAAYARYDQAIAERWRTPATPAGAARV